MEASAGHWVESLFPAQYSINDYRATFQPARVRRYITTLSAYDAPTLAAIYEQSYLFSLIQRLAKEETEEEGKRKSRANQTEPVDSVLDIRLIRAFLEKHKESKEQCTAADDLWTSDEIVTIRSVYLKTRDDCLRFKSESEYYRQELANLQAKVEETDQMLSQLQNEHLSLKKVHTRWTIRTNSSEQLLDEHRRESEDLREHVQKLTEQNELLRRTHLQMQTTVLEKQARLEHLEKRIEHYDLTLKRESDRRVDLLEKRAQVEKERLSIEKSQLKTQLDKEQDLRRQNLLALDQLRKHIALPHQPPACEIKDVKYV